MTDRSTTFPTPSALATFPADTQAAHGRWLETADASAIDTVVLAVLQAYMPADRRPTKGNPPADPARLIADLGFDSLSLAEVAFVLEDLYHVHLHQTELTQLVTVGDLRAFVRTRATINATRRSA